MEPPPAAPLPKSGWSVGVNGAGKTTTIGKLAAQLARPGEERWCWGRLDTSARRPSISWGSGRAHAGAELVKRQQKAAIPGSVAFEAVKRRPRARSNPRALIDTAGRLHTKAPLMEELKKVKRVLQKAEPGAPQQILLVLDATNGQNAIAQARQFHEALQVDGAGLDQAGRHRQGEAS